MHRHFLLASAALLAFVLIGQARADITYNLVNHPGDQSGSTLAGYITTDGKIGDLAAGNILSWSWTVTPASGPATTFRSSDPGGATLLNGQVVATATEILLFTPSSSNPNYLVLENAPSTYILTYERVTAGGYYYNFNPNAGGWNTLNPSMGGADPWVIASTVPEPSALTLLGLGAVGLAVASRRRASAA